MDKSVQSLSGETTSGRSADEERLPTRDPVLRLQAQVQSPSAQELTSFPIRQTTLDKALVQLGVNSCTIKTAVE